ncbi:hypothetical protein [Geminisphaera colitermitum]|uniref:hypothetical protein n=1 Tax=Geminisphaera colitermitum TaxID=1148786 RepID=UPI001E2A8EC7|nr:hypothetical protein [Geminisphaera colitermitum]
MSSINEFLLTNNLRIATNPCVSPDFCLDWPALRTQLEDAAHTPPRLHRPRHALRRPR